MSRRLGLYRGTSDHCSFCLKPFLRWEVILLACDLISGEEYAFCNNAKHSTGSLRFNEGGCSRHFEIRIQKEPGRSHFNLKTVPVRFAGMVRALSGLRDPHVGMNFFQRLLNRPLRRD